VTAAYRSSSIPNRAMFDGDITNDSYALAKLKEPRILAFMQKITVAEDPEVPMPCEFFRHPNTLPKSARRALRPVFEPRPAKPVYGNAGAGKGGHGGTGGDSQNAGAPGAWRTERSPGGGFHLFLGGGLQLHET
jgi:hypothetical protein